MSTKLFTQLCKRQTLVDAWKIVKTKNTSGGIDGISVSDYEADINQHITDILNELKEHKWKPQPYLTVQIPKNKQEKRKLGLLSVKDKIIQCAIKALIEPSIEKALLGNSYAYRPQRGHTRAIRRAQYECSYKTRNWVLRLDIDNYFDSINHESLCKMLHTHISDEEIVRLIMLAVQMGVVNKRLKWTDTEVGVPQGAILSPLLSNLYLNDFDKFVVKQCGAYVRYADDFCLFCETKEQAEQLLSQITAYLKDNLSLGLNPPIIKEIAEGFEFLGIVVSKQNLSITPEKEKTLEQRIHTFQITEKGISPEFYRVWQGVKNYYGKLLPQPILHQLDEKLKARITSEVAKNFSLIKGQDVLTQMLNVVEFLSEGYQANKKQVVKECVSAFQHKKSEEKTQHTKSLNQKLIDQRKAEYRKREGENSELVISAKGCFVGLTNQGITVKQKGTVIAKRPIGSLSHITITGSGISLSSNLIDYCLGNKITIDFFNYSGGHLGSILSDKYMDNTLWAKQAQCSAERRMLLARSIIEAKLKNQFGLVKYFHKYHKHCEEGLGAQYDELALTHELFKKFVKEADVTEDKFVIDLVGHESQGAIRYWSYIREMLKDDEVQFEKREHKGATDLVNCMLNYGYAILYTRVWQALLGAKLNPYDSIIHVRQTGKPTFVYDVVEIFRSQVVDRVVISLVQKGKSLKMAKGLLEEETKKLLSRSILERLNRYEKYRAREVTMDQIIHLQVKEMADWIEKGTHYKPYIAKW
jgi:group II intron reverse transcriptase/maturase/CRISPR-associated endonuclease Cas1